ncbi:MAG: NAD-dependent epimerase/dehydratase family protein [Paracoccaceae bacterium]
MKVVVTGAGGYIGAVLVPMLLEEGHDVVALDRFFFGDTLPEHERLTKRRADSRFLTIDDLEGAEAVIDLVAISNDPSGEEFRKETLAINWRARSSTAALAKEAGVKRYVLPSSCSIYGFQDKETVVDESWPTNPLTTYAIANEKAEHDVLRLASDDFCVVVLRQATVYGLSPRMRFDLAINGMTYGAYKTGRLPLMRDGTQWRPMVHVKDTASAQIFMLTAPAGKVSGQIFNVGSEANVYQLSPLAEIVADYVPRDVEVEFYGDVDHRSYRVSFDKIEALGWKAARVAADGVAEICRAMDEGLEKDERTITLAWYRRLEEMRREIAALELHGGLLRL